MGPITRRELLRRLGLGGAALALGPPWLSGCASDGVEPGGEFPFTMWRELQRALRSSPDHLPARARALVAARDIEGLAALVTDAIRTLPTVRRGTEQAATSIRWGAGGALRAGAGTPREKCDLLVTLLGEAGIPASVVISRETPEPAEWEAFLAPRAPSPFLPDIAPRTLERWATVLGRASTPSRDLDGELDASSLALAARVLAAEGLPAPRPQGQDLRSGPLPLVRVELEGVPYVLSPAVPGDRPRPLPDGDGLQEAPPASAPYTVTARLSCVTTADPRRPRLLVERSWEAPDLIGRRIALGTVPALPPETMGATAFSGIQALIPFLAVQGAGIDEDTAERLATVGDPVTLSGEVIEVRGDVPVIDGVPLTPGGSASLNSVMSLEFEVDAAGFPTLHGRLVARDAAGAPVEGLQGPDFRIIDEGQDVPALLTANRRSPSVVLMMDQSLSMPGAFRREAGTELAERLRGSILQRFPGARVHYRETNSDLWSWLGWARSRSPELTVFITDGDLGDALTDSLRELLSGSGPTLLLNVRPGREARFSELAEVTGASVASVTEADSALAEILGALERVDVPPYRLRFGATGETPESREVRVVTADGRLEATARYAVPGTAAAGERICGVHLVLELSRGGARTALVERTLGGFDRRFEAPPSEVHVVEAREALLGALLIQVEGGGPPPSVRLDDFLEGQIGLEPFVRAIADGSDLGPLAPSADTTVPPELLALTAPLEDPLDQAVVFEEGLRMILYRTAFRLGTDRVERSVDLLPTLGATGAHRDPRTAFEATLRATARLAAMEAAAFPVSTMALGGDLPLRRAASASALPVELDRAGRVWWDHLIRGHGRPVMALVPSPPPPGRKALWELNPATGEIRGILDDGSGGGSEEERIRRQVEEFDRVMAYYGLLFQAMGTGKVVGGIGGFSLGVVAAYNQALVNLYAAVTLVLINMDASGLDAAIRESLRQFACNVAREAFLGAVGGAGKAAGNAVEMFNAVSNLLGAFYPNSALSEAISC